MEMYHSYVIRRVLIHLDKKYDFKYQTRININYNRTQYIELMHYNQEYNKLQFEVSRNLRFRGRSTPTKRECNSERNDLWSTM